VITTEEIVEAIEAGELATLDLQTRVDVGLEGEELICNCLITHYGYNLIRVSKFVDMYDKLDRIIRTRHGDCYVAVKFRSDKPHYVDILVELYSEYVDFTDKTIGRDNLSQYGAYICGVRDYIYVVNGPCQKGIVRDVLAEWESKGAPTPYFRSALYSGVKIILSKDPSTKTQKLLMMIDPKVYEARDIMTYKWIR
jgi:hypothetical protein